MSYKPIHIIIVLLSALLLFVLVGVSLFLRSSYRNAMLKTSSSALSSESEQHVSLPPLYIAPERDLTSDEQDALNIPLHSASQQEKQRHAQIIAQLAQTAPVLDITGCKPEPLVYRVNLKDSFQIKNNDVISHSFRYLTTQIFIPAREITTVRTSQLFTTAGDYGYGCDNPFARMGVLMVR